MGHQDLSPVQDQQPRVVGEDLELSLALDLRKELGDEGTKVCSPLWSEPLQPYSRYPERRKSSLLPTGCGCWWGQTHGVDVAQVPPVSLPALCHCPGLCTSPCAGVVLATFSIGAEFSQEEKSTTFSCSWQNSLPRCHPRAQVISNW